MASLPKTYKAIVISQANGPAELKEVELKKPSHGEVLVKVLACGVCLSDSFEQKGFMGNAWPATPGHEIIGDVAALGEGVTSFQVGERVGGGWHGGHDSSCRSCQRAQFQMCDNKAINGVTRAGGYAEYVLLRAEAVVRVPSSLDPAEAAPLLCAGITVFNGLRKLHIEQGNLVAVQGLGGLGHLAVQYSRAMGYRTVAITRGEDKRAFAAQLGAHEYINTEKEDVVARLTELGGAAAILATAPSPAAIAPLIGGLQNCGHLLVLAPVGPVAFDTGILVRKGASVHGWPSGHALDSEEAVHFSLNHGVKCMVERFPLAEAGKALESVEQGKPRFRNVLVME